MKMSEPEIFEEFKYYPMSPDAVKAAKEIGEAATHLVKAMAKHCTYGRETALAKTKLDESILWAHRALVQTGRQSVPFGYKPEEKQDD
jgi:hypothetical protein